MALTAKPIATISYNTESFLKRKLDELLESNRIVDYRYIKHIGEDGDKDHIHLIMFPNRRIDTGVLRIEFNEATNENDKPLGVLPIYPSKPNHWIMYVIHDPDYLKAHKSDNDGDGKIPYSVNDIITPFEEQLRRDYKKALVLKDTDNIKIVKGMNEGKKLIDIAIENDINPMRIGAIYNLQRIQSSLDDLKRVEEIRQQEARQISNALETFGNVKVEEELGATKNEKQLGLTRVLETTYTLDDETGEVKQEKEIKVKSYE